MSILRKLEPRKGAIDVRRTLPLSRSMEEFLENFPSRRWMETFGPFGWKWPTDVEYERAFRLDIVDRDKEADKGDFYRHELGYGKLMRTVALPVEVDGERIHADLKEGVLKVTFPKIRVAEKHTVKVA